MTALCTSKKFRQVCVGELNQPVPATTSTYEPVPHGKFYDMVASGLVRQGYVNVSEDLRISQNGDEFFGILNLRSPYSVDNSPWDVSIGLRNTNNKRASAGVFLGTNVWVCDNLQFSAEHTFLRKHHAGTIGVLREGVAKIMEHLSPYRDQQSRHVEKLQRWIMTPEVRDHVLVSLLRARAISGNEVLPIINEFLSPSEGNPEAQYDSGWGLMNAVTWIGKNGFNKNPETQATRSIAANNVFSDALILNDGFRRNS